MPTWASPRPPSKPGALPGVPGTHKSWPRYSALRTSTLMRLARAWYWRRRKSWPRDLGGEERTLQLVAWALRHCNEMREQETP